MEENLKTIEDLKSQLSSREAALKKVQQDSARQLLEAESRNQVLQKQISKTRRMEGSLSLLLNTRGDIEKNLVSARQVLIEKLREKELLEKDLNHHRTELERRLSEKQRLEELLFEKSKFEQELRNQKEQLQIDLDGIEKKLKLGSGLSNEKLNWSNDGATSDEQQRQTPLQT